MNSKLRQKAENNFEKDFFKLMNTSVFGKTIENMRRHGNIKLVTTERRRIIQYHNQIIILQTFLMQTYQPKK